ncbi:hypothetical protein LTR91_021149 [Friedmanniomyces endolithicus]|uniref:Zn(2)-C6 fungal-type domain-containing protein n=1 Tax=Friedmanniomyces endolithicus TaxID=329885 RepID=A0AAN6HD23_9PEZI|nr:hypothetical protein LTS09_010197 [Friedmanniomyces endolithicus]KAK0366759.1 hypothetical protein LTR94_001518 [Friedmanniomyces endolithicus]KAK0774576.1 hypothetical protein LTR38_016176 [Friedmanniomyces endolithicus]KAK0778186.1 hypothetical protein LTR75_015735 [Friedmanniomyces endolithicus]KAK0810337.1 hypothetical protein LTR59_002330 [Friedmanniomyces endolithicus]
MARLEEGTVIQPQPQPQLLGTKRRAACDECREKKLRCTGEQPACARCESESVACVYSAQKQMGRPKKRRRVEREDDEGEERPIARRVERSRLEASDATVSNATEPGVGVNGDGGTGSSVLDDFLTPSGGLQPWEQSTEWIVPSEHALPGLIPDSASNSSPNNNLPTETQPSHITSSLETHTSNAHLLLEPYLDPQEDDFPPDLFAPQTLPTCACLSTLYLTLSTLQSMAPSFPFPSSLHPLREAMRTASEVLSCPLCPTKFLSAVQNTQLVGTLLVSIAERFGKVLEAITREAARAGRMGEVKGFRFADLETLHTGGVGCRAGFCISLSADEWRGMAKKVVRAEVLGPSDGDVCSPYFVGMVEQMESRSEYWHHQEMPLDFPRDADGRPLGGKNMPKEDHVCLKLCAYSRKLIATYDWS